MALLGEGDRCGLFDVFWPQYVIAHKARMTDAELANVLWGKSDSQHINAVVQKVKQLQEHFKETGKVIPKLKHVSGKKGPKGTNISKESLLEMFAELELEPAEVENENENEAAA